PVRAVLRASRCECVERDARRAIADRVDVRLQSQAVEREDRGVEDLGPHQRRPALFAVDIRLEQGRRLRFERAVEAELDGRDLEPLAAIFPPEALDAL